MKRNTFSEQTHFIGVLLPEDITLTLEDCRRYMRESYGCKSGYGTPVHVTLVPPFHLPKEFSTSDIAEAIAGIVAPKGLGFAAKIDNFDAFGDRTIFAKVVCGEEWTNLRDETLKSVLSVCPGCAKKDKRPFQPHATVANRDIPEGASTKALEALNGMNMREEFLVDSITVFERNGGRWEPAATVPISSAIKTRSGTTADGQ